MRLTLCHGLQISELKMEAVTTIEVLNTKLQEERRLHSATKQALEDERAKRRLEGERSRGVAPSVDFLFLYCLMPPTRFEWRDVNHLRHAQTRSTASRSSLACSATRSQACAPSSSRARESCQRPQGSCGSRGSVAQTSPRHPLPKHDPAGRKVLPPSPLPTPTPQVETFLSLCQPPHAHPAGTDFVIDARAQHGAIRGGQIHGGLHGRRRQGRGHRPAGRGRGGLPPAGARGRKGVDGRGCPAGRGFGG